MLQFFVQRCILTETRSLNKAVESIPMLETGEQATGGSKYFTIRCILFMPLAI
jgi:hypothetical protein